MPVFGAKLVAKFIFEPQQGGPGIGVVQPGVGDHHQQGQGIGPVGVGGQPLVGHLHRLGMIGKLLHQAIPVGRILLAQLKEQRRDRPVIGVVLQEALLGLLGSFGLPHRLLGLHQGQGHVGGHGRVLSLQPLQQGNGAAAAIALDQI